MDELRQQSGYGRATIGETVRLLSERGTVDVRPGRGGGLFVASLNPVARLRRTLLAVPQGGSTVSDAIAVREALEELIALDAARHRTPDDMADLLVCMSAMTGTRDDWGAFMTANWILHERIAGITPNHLATGVYVGTIRCVVELSVHAEPAEGTTTDYLDERIAIHAQLVDAIVSGDVEATLKAVEAHRGITVAGNTADTTASGT